LLKLSTTLEELRIITIHYAMVNSFYCIHGRNFQFSWLRNNCFSNKRKPVMQGKESKNNITFCFYRFFIEC